MRDNQAVRSFRTLFLSDFHLGTKTCQAERLLDFLRVHEAETVYLVGDIVDGWQLQRAWFWPQTHNDVVQKLLRWARKGARIVVIPGNHDEFLHNYPGKHFGGIEVAGTAIHEMADGTRLLVMHGDQFDVIIRHAPWLSKLGDGAYRLALGLNVLLNKARRALGLPYWSLSSWAKHKVKNYVSLIGTFEESLVAEARRAGVDGIVCGHIHHADLHDRLGIRYVNTGDWVESCTAVAEHFDGKLEIIRWLDREPSQAGAEAEAEQEQIAA